MAKPAFLTATLGEWLREAAVLVAVFAPLDMVLAREWHSSIFWGTVAFWLPLLLIGLWLGHVAENQR